MAKRDYYEVLGVAKGADDAAIKSAYRRLAKQYHPDINPNNKEAEEKFKEASEAYEILSDAQKRAAYDRYGHDGPANFGGGASSGGFGGFGGVGDIGDIFDAFFGGMGGGGRSSARPDAPQRGNNLQYNMRLTFEEAAFGVKKTITVEREENCDICSGTGAKPGSKFETCPVCNGSGQVQTVQNTPFGRFSSASVCEKCHGKGRIVETPCTGCNGSGRAWKKRKIEVSIPAGIDNGQAVTLRGEGEAGINNGPAGDLFVRVTVAPHNVFQREGYDLYMDLPVSYAQAVLGSELQVATLEKPISYTMPEGTQPGTVFRLRGNGIKRLNGNTKGDLFVRIQVEVPKRLSGEQRDLLRQLDAAMGSTVVQKDKSFFDKVKDAFN